MDPNRDTAPKEDGAARANALLREAIDVLDCNYALYTPARFLVDCNRSYYNLHQSTFRNLGFPDYATVRANAGAIRFEDLIGAAIRGAHPHWSEEHVQAELAGRVADHDASQDGQDIEREYSDQRWLRVAKRRLQGGEVAGIGIDIAASKCRELAISAREAEYRALLDTSPVGIWYLDEDGQTLFGNARLANLYGGRMPASLDEAPLHRIDTQAGTGPFGFPPGREVEAVIPGASTRRRANVLVCASAWFARDGNQKRGAVLSLLDITPLKAAQTRAEHLAWHDALTGLANRAQFRYAIDAALSAGEPVSLILVDLDRFKEANDRFGHAAGDAVLCETAMRLRGAVSVEDLVCRMGGDEFAILLRGPDAPARAAPLGSTLAVLLATPTHAAQQTIGMSASIGFASWPLHAANAEDLQRAADLALYAAKNAGRSRAAGFEPYMLEERERSARLGAALADAIQNDGLMLVWQPQVRLPGTSMRAAEALVRWPGNPIGKRMAMPDQILPVAEEAGLVTALDNWVMETALRQARDWEGVPGAPEKIAINVSRRALSDPTLPQRVAGLLLRYGVAPQVLEIEVPESLAARDLDEVTPVLAELSDMGIGLALDDFGGGLSSVSHLVRLPVSLIKLDRSIVAGLPGERERMILRAVMSLADGLSIPVLAEGIETDAQAFALRREGCTLMQGFLFGRPVPSNVLVPSPPRSLRA